MMKIGWCIMSEYRICCENYICHASGSHHMMWCEANIYVSGTCTHHLTLYEDNICHVTGTHHLTWCEDNICHASGISPDMMWGYAAGTHRLTWCEDVPLVHIAWHDVRPIYVMYLVHITWRYVKTIYVLSLVHITWYDVRTMYVMPRAHIAWHDVRTIYAMPLAHITWHDVRTFMSCHWHTSTDMMWGNICHASGTHHLTWCEDIICHAPGTYHYHLTWCKDNICPVPGTRHLTWFEDNICHSRGAHHLTWCEDNICHVSGTHHLTRCENGSAQSFQKINLSHGNAMISISLPYVLPKRASLNGNTSSGLHVSILSTADDIALSNLIP